MTSHQNIVLWAALSITASFVLPGAGAAVKKPRRRKAAAAPSGKVAFERERRQILDWLDRYRQVQVLFQDEHVEKIRAKVAGMSKDELHRWLAETARVRAVLDSDAWKETRQWYREFLRVQAIYSEEDIERFREKAARASPEELLRIVMDIKRRREALRWMHAASETQRRRNLAMWDTFQHQAAAARHTPRKAGYHSGMPSVSAGTAAGEGSRRVPRYHVPPPIITSGDVARGAVWSSIFGGYGWGW